MSVPLLFLGLLALVRSYWVQPDGLCSSSLKIYSDSGWLSTNKGLQTYSNDMACTWDINTKGTHVYLILNGTSSPEDYIDIAGQQFQMETLNAHLAVASSSFSVTFFSDQSNTSSGFNVYWTSVLVDETYREMSSFYNSTSGRKGWIKSWPFGDTSSHYCNWIGITCDYNFSVTGINLKGNSLVGTVPSLAMLTSLVSLDLSNNFLYGVLPSELLVSSLKECNLEGNDFCGDTFPVGCFPVTSQKCMIPSPTPTPDSPPPSTPAPPVPSPTSSPTPPPSRPPPTRLPPVLLNNSATIHFNSTPPYVKIPKSRAEASILLSSTKTNIVISGVIADVKIVQIYQNNGATAVDIEYYFPSSPTAVVYGMQFINNGELFIAQIKTSQEALAIYNLTSAAGNTTALLEKEDDAILKLSIANLAPHSTLRIEVFYTENIIPDQGIYQYYYPTILPPQYLNEVTGANQDPSMFNHLFSLTVDVQLPLPISHISCLTHDIHIEVDNTTASTNLSYVGFPSNFLLEYSMLGNEILAGTLVYQTQKDNDTDRPFILNSNGTIQYVDYENNYFMSIIQTPSSDTILPFIVPREYIFVIDTSASMVGRPTGIVNSLMQGLLDVLKPNVDMFNIITFSGSPLIFQTRSVLATKDNLKEAQNYINKSTISGYSSLLPALKKAVEIPRNYSYSRIITILTDGLIPISKSVLQFVHESNGLANFYSFAIGEIPNRYLTQGIATVGRGKEFWVQNKNVILDVTKRFITHVLSPVLTNITLEFSPLFHVDTSTLWPSLKGFGDVMLDKPLVISGKYSGELPTTKLFTISGKTSTGSVWKKDVFPTLLTSKHPRSLVYLWAGNIIRDKEYISEDSNEITNLALQYHILSKSTSFIAVGTNLYFPDSNVNVISLGGQKRSVVSCLKACNCSLCVGMCAPSMDDCGNPCPVVCPNGERCTSGVCATSTIGPLSPTRDPTPPTSIVPRQKNSPPPITPVTIGGTPQAVPNPTPGTSTPIPTPDPAVTATPTPTHIPSTSPKVIPCLSGCDSLSTCDFDLGECVQVVNDITANCEGTFIGGQNYICNNGNFIYMSSTESSTSTAYYLEGSLAVEGNFTMPNGTTSITITADSTITVGSIMGIPQEAQIIINFKDVDIEIVGIKNLEGYTIQLVSAQEVQGNFSSWRVVNQPAEMCKVALHYSQGVLLSFSNQCSQDGEVGGEGVVWIVLWAVLGVIGLAFIGAFIKVVQSCQKRKEIEEMLKAYKMDL